MHTINSDFANGFPPQKYVHYKCWFRKWRHLLYNKFVRNEQNINSNMITNNNISKVESYTKKFGQILNKNDKKL